MCSRSERVGSGSSSGSEGPSRCDSSAHTTGLCPLGGLRAFSLTIVLVSGLLGIAACILVDQLQRQRLSIDHRYFVEKIAVKEVQAFYAAVLPLHHWSSSRSAALVDIDCNIGTSCHLKREFASSLSARHLAYDYGNVTYTSGKSYLRVVKGGRYHIYSKVTLYIELPLPHTVRHRIFRKRDFASAQVLSETVLTVPENDGASNSVAVVTFTGRAAELFDNDAIYVLVECSDGKPGGIKSGDSSYIGLYSI